MRRDERDAFERLCREEHANLVRTAWLITGDREEAMDLAQEAFARAYARWRTVSGLDRPGAWLTRVVVNLAISWRRRRAVVGRVQLPLTMSAPPADEMVTWADDPVILALRQLPPAQRTAVVLRYFVDLSVEEAARVLGKRPSTIRALTSQAVSRLRATFPATGLEEAADEL